MSSLTYFNVLITDQDFLIRRQRRRVFSSQDYF